MNTPADTPSGTDPAARERALLIVVSAPSGAGKTTLCDRLLESDSTMVYSVSCCTRPPRGNDVDGRDYIFLSRDEFLRRVVAGDFLEYAIVHGHYYGTLKDTVGEALRAGRSVLMDIDVQGARQVRNLLAGRSAEGLLANRLVDIFIAPPSLDALRERLAGRGTDSPEVIEQRLRNAEVELASAGEYRYTVVNDDLDKAERELKAIVEKECRRHE